MKIEWSRDLETGVGIIDDQHKKLVVRISCFVEAVNEGDMKVIEDTVNYLIGYAIQHFGAEELIMIRNGYSDFKSHRDEHSKFIKKVYDMKKSLLEKTLTKEMIYDMRTELIDWTVHHIKVVDMKIAKELEN